MVGITAVIWGTQALPSSRVLLPLALAGLTTVISFIIELVLLRLFGTITDFQSITVLPNILLLHILAILPLYWLLYLINRAIRPRQVQL
jgi:hypothetical protein